MSTQPGVPLADATPLTRVAQAVRWHWIELVVALLAAGVGAQALVASLPDQFETVAIVVLEPANEQGSDASLIRLRAPTYVSYLLADATHELMTASLGPDAPQDLRSMEVELVSDTGTMLITTANEDPARAQALATAAVEQANLFSQRELNLQLSVVSPPVLPSLPVGPPRRLILVAALLASGLLALGAAMLWDQARPRIGSGTALARVAGAPTLATVPRRRSVSTQLESTHPSVLTSMRVLRTHLGDMSVPCTLAVLSSVRGEGRTTITAHLAQSMASLDLRVAMVDLDLTTPALSTSFDPDGSMRRLAEVVRGTRTLAESAAPSGVDGVWMLSAEPSLSVDALVRELPRIVKLLSAHFDVVLIDTPPILGDDLARTVATTVGKGLLVASTGTPRVTVERGVAALENLHVELVGCVLNRARDHR